VNNGQAAAATSQCGSVPETTRVIVKTKTIVLAIEIAINGVSGHGREYGKESWGVDLTGLANLSGPPQNAAILHGRPEVA
jgi:hypothetical protein